MPVAKTVPRFRCRTVPLGRRRDRRDFESLSYEELDRAPPFSVNPRGQLVHRVRFVSVICREGKPHHIHVSHLCGNGFNADVDFIRDVLTDDPPRERFLCSTCHGRTEAMRLPLSDQLAGRHVHRGVLVPQQVCCQHAKGKRKP